MIIEGSQGAIVLGPLFIKADGFTVYPSRRLAAPAKPGSNHLMARIRRKLFRYVSPPGMLRHHHGFEGSGLQFEIEAASNAIRQGRREEPHNTLNDTLAALRIIDDVLSRPAETG
jgi:hypothetical protein